MIVRKKDVRSGKPTIEGTRVTVGDIVERFYGLDRSLQDIASDLDIDEVEVEEALRFYNREIIDDDKFSVEA